MLNKLKWDTGRCFITLEILQALFKAVNIFTALWMLISGKSQVANIVLILNFSYHNLEL